MTNPEFQTAAQALDSLKAVLCDPEGRACIHGSNGDLTAIDRALANLQRMVPIDREVPNDLSISAYMHCGKCLAEMPNNQSPREWAQLEVGWTNLGLQVWCRRHECNVIHVDFQGANHPANLTAAA